jgi:hypothetical protein
MHGHAFTGEHARIVFILLLILLFSLLLNLAGELARRGRRLSAARKRAG